MDTELHAALERHRELLQEQLAHFRAELIRELRAEIVARHREVSERISAVSDNVNDGLGSVAQQMRTMKLQLDTIQRRTGYDTAALERAVESIERDLGLVRDSMTRELSLQRDQAYRMDRASHDRLIRLGDAMRARLRS